MKLFYLVLPIILVLLSCSGEAPEIIEFSIQEITTDVADSTIKVVKYRCIISDADKDCYQVNVWDADYEVYKSYELDDAKSEVDTFHFAYSMPLTKSDSVVKNIYVQAVDKRDNMSPPSETLTVVLKK